MSSRGVLLMEEGFPRRKRTFIDYHSSRYKVQ